MIINCRRTYENGKAVGSALRLFAEGYAACFVLEIGDDVLALSGAELVQSVARLFQFLRWSEY